MNQENRTNNEPEMVQNKPSDKETLKKKVFKTCHDMESNNKKITRDAVREITGGSDRDLSRYIKEYRELKEVVQKEEDSGTPSDSMVQEESVNGTKGSSSMVQDESVTGTPSDSMVQEESVNGTKGSSSMVQDESVTGTESDSMLQSESANGTKGGNLMVQDESANGTISSADENEEIENLETDAYYNEPSNDMEAIARRGSEIAAAALIAEKAVADYMLQNPNQLPDDLKQQVNQANAQFDEKIKHRQQQYKPDFFVKGAIAAAKRKASVPTR